jgi:hypothetical protein
MRHARRHRELIEYGECRPDVATPESDRYFDEFHTLYLGAKGHGFPRARPVFEFCDCPHTPTRMVLLSDRHSAIWTTLFFCNPCSNPRMHNRYKIGKMLSPKGRGLTPLESRYRAALSGAVVAKARYLSHVGERFATPASVQRARWRWERIEARKLQLALQLRETQAIPSPSHDIAEQLV